MPDIASVKTCLVVWDEVLGTERPSTLTDLCDLIENGSEDEMTRFAFIVQRAYRKSMMTYTTEFPGWEGLPSPVPEVHECEV